MGTYPSAHLQARGSITLTGKLIDPEAGDLNIPTIAYWGTTLLLGPLTSSKVTVPSGWRVGYSLYFVSLKAPLQFATRTEQTYLPGDGVWLANWDLLMETRPRDGVTNWITHRLGPGRSNTSESRQNGTENGERPHC